MVNPLFALWTALGNAANAVERFAAVFDAMAEQAEQRACLPGKPPAEPAADRKPASLPHATSQAGNGKRLASK